MSEANIETSTAAKPYTFRQLGGEDMFLMFRIIGKIGVKEFNACFENDGIRQLIAGIAEEKAAEGEDEKSAPSAVTYIAVILEIADVIFKNLPKCEDEVFKLLSQTSDLTIEQVKALSLAQFTEMVVDFIKKEEFRDFIKVVSKLFG